MIPAAYTPEGHARFYEEVRAALGLREVAVLGHPFGAITGLMYCALFPEAVTRFVCVAGSALSADPLCPPSARSPRAIDNSPQVTTPRPYSHRFALPRYRPLAGVR